MHACSRLAFQVAEFTRALSKSLPTLLGVPVHVADFWHIACIWGILLKGIFGIFGAVVILQFLVGPA